MPHRGRALSPVRRCCWRGAPIFPGSVQIRSVIRPHREQKRCHQYVTPYWLSTHSPHRLPLRRTLCGDSLKRGGQAFDPTRDVAIIEARIPHHETGVVRTIGSGQWVIERCDGIHADPRRPRRGDQHGLLVLGTASARRRHAARHRRRQPSPHREPGLQGGQEGGAPLAVPPADPPHMPLVGAAADQIGQGLLLQARRMPVRQPLRLPESRRSAPSGPRDSRGAGSARASSRPCRDR